MKKYFVSLLLVSVLTACSESEDIKAVKGLIYEKLDNSNTVGNILSNRSMCQTLSWQSYTDDKKRTLVEYQCDFQLKAPTAYLNQSINERIKALNQRKIDPDKSINPKAYQQYVQELKDKNDYQKNLTHMLLKTTPSTVGADYFKVYLDQGLSDYVHLKFNTDIYPPLQAALNEIAQSDALSRYQTNRRYLLDNQSTIESSIRMKVGNQYNTGEKLINAIYFYALNFTELKAAIYGINGFFTNEEKDKEMMAYLGETVFTKLVEINEDIAFFKSVFHRNGLTFDLTNGLADNSVYSNNYINLRYSQDFEHAYLMLLNGNLPEKVTIKGSKTAMEFANYQALLAHLYQREIKQLQQLRTENIEPINKWIDGTVQALQDVKKIKQYRQAIIWSVLQNKPPVLLNCTLTLNLDYLPNEMNIKTDNSFSQSCFSAAYQDHYIGDIYNQPINYLLDEIEYEM